MGKIYNEVAGRDIDRLAALTDGIFAFAMTLLILDIRVPNVKDTTNGNALLHALVSVDGPRLLTCVMTFLTLGIFWVGHQTHLKMLKGSDRNLTWMHIGFMFAIVLMPFSTSLLASYIDNHVAILVYWLNIVLLGVPLYASYKYAEQHDLVDTEGPVRLEMFQRRIAVAQTLYFLAMLISFANTRASIAALLLIQLNYALAPKLPWLYRQ